MSGSRGLHACALQPGRIWLARLGPAVGRGNQATRPGVVVWPNAMSARLRTLIVAPMASGLQTSGCRVAFTCQGRHGLSVRTPLRVPGRVRLVKRLGALRPATLAK